MGIYSQSNLTFVELNCENLFDCRHDTLKNDYEYCEGGAKNWNFSRYWRKLNNIGREIVACGDDGQNWYLPDFVALTEIENDSCMYMLTRRSLLNRAHYEYIMTNSADPRGIDVALLYSPLSFTPTAYYGIRVKELEEKHPTRDILYVKGILKYPNREKDKSLHILVVHAPSRSGGQLESEPYRMAVSNKICFSIDSIHNIESDADIIIAGDFNDYHDNKSLQRLENHHVTNVSVMAKGRNGAQGTYRFQGEWGSLDHILVSHSLLNKYKTYDCFINDLDFLIEEDTKYGGYHPIRTYLGPRYNPNGFSDHLPLVLRFLP